MPDENVPPTMRNLVLGGYRIVSRLGAGGMGSVYKAQDEALDRFVAIKVLADSLSEDETCVERFLREARAIASLRHPNLMHVYTVGEEEGLHYFVMEYIEGVSLAKHLSTAGRLALPEAMIILGQVMSALHKCHTADIVHRDLKPGNIMIDSDRRAILVDFGLAKDANSSFDLTGAGSILGTPDYMAPEQIEGDDIGPSTDIYSLGVVLYEMLSQVLPFHRKSAILTMRAHCEDAPAPLSQHRPDVPKILVAILNKMLSREPNRRYRSVSALARDLLRVHPTPELQALAHSATAPANADTIAPGVAQPDSAPTLPSADRAPAVDNPTRPKPAPSKKKKPPRSRLPAGKNPPKREHPLRPKRPRDTSLFVGIGIAVVVVVVLAWVFTRGRPGGSDTDGDAGTTSSAPGALPRKVFRPKGVTGPIRGVSQPEIVVIRKDGPPLRGILIRMDAESVEIESRPGRNRIVIPVSNIRALRGRPERSGRRTRR